MLKFGRNHIGRQSTYLLIATTCRVYLLTCYACIQEQILLQSSHLIRLNIQNWKRQYLDTRAHEHCDVFPKQQQEEKQCIWERWLHKGIKARVATSPAHLRNNPADPHRPSLPLACFHTLTHCISNSFIAKVCNLTCRENKQHKRDAAGVLMSLFLLLCILPRSNRRQF